MPDAARRRSAPAFVTSCVFGTLGAVFLLTGLLAGSDLLVIVATALGALSLIAALVWRGQLIQQWRADRYRRSVASPTSPPADR
ncbi:MAG: hypothetical protein M3O23_00905 [Actinomycetota bacterium]|nr:hypothetical protein [Actinomycetota bacterium]